MAAINSFESDTLVCGVSYLLNPDKSTRFNALINCAKKAGLSEQCALLWAHYGASIVSACSNVCNAGTSSTTNGPPPECALSPCVACPNTWGANFNNISGRTLEGSGISDGTAKPCDSFTRIVQDPCVGAATGAALSPTPSPNSGAAAPMTRVAASLNYLFSVLLAVAAIASQ